MRNPANQSRSKRPIYHPLRLPMLLDEFRLPTLLASFHPLCSCFVMGTRKR
jgi:hypothetical protein